MFNFLKNLFFSPGEDAPEKHLDNTRLNFLLNTFKDHPSEANNQLILKEITEGHCFFIIPSAGIEKDGHQISAPENLLVNAACFSDVDGLKTVGVFTEQYHLMRWAQTPMEYVNLKCTDALELFQANKINHIVINVGAANAFVLGHHMGSLVGWPADNNIVKIGPLTAVLTSTLTENLNANLQAINNVLEAYSFALVKDGRQSVIFAAKLARYSDEGRYAFKYAVEDALAKEKQVSYALDIFFLESDEWYKNVSEINNALIYKKAL